MRPGLDGPLEGVRYIASPNCDARPPGTPITLLVVHSISLPAGRFGGDAIERLFTNRLDPAAHPDFIEPAALRVSAHFLVRRDGELIQFVPVGRRAWHAGESLWRARPRCNDFSIGVELEGAGGVPYEPAQYACLARLVGLLRALLPLRDVAAHSDVAPQRKIDPGPSFDWPRLFGALAQR